ncbi:M56 family metallopeptidase [uncultured Pontibacter sp.]|uniref:M56 family metallopeptidase n=1 Tax=uncultured Pontibacter sp. TaxID=453356 RepID=UPI00260D7897|nr:M56 family metallopeptidase [uncultured Pontibacter sp.]
MNLIENLMPEALVSALGWTLLHALWQGAFVALLLSLLLVLMHRQPARVRYAVASSAMLVQLLLSIGTFAYYFSKPAAVAAPQQSMAIAAVVPAGIINASFWADPLGIAQVYFEQHLPLLVTVWLLGLLLMALRFTGGLAYTQRLRHYKTSALSEQWQQKLHMLQRRMGMRQAVRLAESALVQVPMAIGVAKPVILLPVGAVTGLTQAQVEAILAHELAHILRKDYLLNLLQLVVDMLYFYHPAMWWVSGVVRAEREHCCDDVAVALCGDSITYARALAELEAMRMPAAPSMVVAFSGQRGSLMNRIKRLVGQPLKPTFTEGFAAGLVLVVGLLAVSVGAMAERKPLEAQKKNTPIIEAAADAEAMDETATAISFVAQDTTGNSRNVVIITNKKGKVKQLYVDGKRIPKKDIDKYKTLVDQRLQIADNAPKANREEVEMLLQQEREALAQARENVREERIIIERHAGDGVPPLPPAPGMPPLPPLPPQPAVPAPGLAPPPPPAPPAPPVGASKKEQKAYEREMEQYKEEMERYEQEEEQAMNRFEREVIVKRIAQDSLRHKEHMIRNHQRAAEMKARQEARQQEMQARRTEMEVRRAEMQERRQQHAENMRQMKEELVKDGIIESDSSNLNIQINNGELSINGKKQPKEVYEKYKKWMEPNRR